MTSIKAPTPDKPIKPSKPRPPQPTNYSPTQKAQAVLAVWTERCTAAEVCRQMHITGMTFTYWQRRAMEGMLQALESRVNLAKGEALNPRLQLLLHKQAAQPNRLSKRLEQIQLASPPDSLSQNP